MRELYQWIAATCPRNYLKNPRQLLELEECESSSIVIRYSAGWSCTAEITVSPEDAEEPVLLPGVQRQGILCRQWRQWLYIVS